MDLEVASACLHSVLQTTGEKWECGKSALAPRAGAPQRTGGDQSNAGSSTSQLTPACLGGDDSFQEPVLAATH